MDEAWARANLDRFCKNVKSWENETRREDGQPGPILDKLITQEPTINRILAALDEGLGPVDADQPIRARVTSLKGLGVLKQRQEWADRLTPESPALLADRLHPWVWNAAQPFWETNHFAQAVQTAAKAINAHLQNKLGRRDVSDDKAVQEAFRQGDAEPGRPRLLVAGDPDDQTVQSVQRGALQLGLGCFFAIRNPLAHGMDELDEQEALEQLATLSTFARLVDGATVVRAR